MWHFRSVTAAVLSAALAVSGANAQDASRKYDEALLPPYVVAHHDLQLQRDRGFEGYNDVQYAANVADCASQVSRHVDAWLTDKKLVAGFRLAVASRYRAEISRSAPKTGYLIIDYSWAKSKRSAILNIRFQSNERLSEAERERLVLGLGLADVREQLISAMNCGEKSRAF
jgi:hypothetical protein